MLCCISRKATARPTNENQRKHEKPVDSDCAGSSSGFSESSSASSGNFSSSGFSPTSSSSSSSSSGFSSASPFFLFDFTNSSSSGSETSNCFDLTGDRLANSSSLKPEVTVGASSELSSSSVEPYPSVQPKRLLSFSPSATVQNLLNGANDNNFVEKDRSAKDEPPALLLPCAICARTFKPESLEKHTKICERSAIKKRKPFDSAKQRIQGTDLAEFLPKETIKRKVYQEEKPVAPIASKPASWKQTHEEFLSAIRAAREKPVDGPGQRQAVAPSHVTVGVPTRPNEKGMCPTCKRQFSIKAYERHVEWCKEHATRTPITPATNVAKERLEARMKYRAPLLKNRRVTNREKYSPGSAVNLTSYLSKNSQARAKESASTPNCNNKGGNEAPMGSGLQSHQKATADTRRSGQTREGISSGPMKSRLSDRSSRPVAVIESGPTTSNQSSSPISPRINVDPRFSLAHAIPLSNVTSPVPTSRSVIIPESTQTASQHCAESSRRIFPNDRKAIQLNIFDGATHRQNIVSARSCGHPKINDISMNDPLTGITVQRCGPDKNDKKEVQQDLVTWKQISQEKHFVKPAKFLRINDGKNLGETPQEMKLTEPTIPVHNYENSRRKSFSTRGMKKLNQTYVIRESLDSKKYSPQILGKIMPIVDKPLTEFDCIRSTSPNRIFNDGICVNWFNANVNITSSPLQCYGKDGARCEVNVSRAVSPVLSERIKLAPLDLKNISNDEFSEQEDTFRSGRRQNASKSSRRSCRKLFGEATRKLKPIRRRPLTCEDSLNSKDFEEENSIESENCMHFSDLVKDIGTPVNSHRVDLLPNTSRCAKTTATQKDNSLFMKMGAKTNSTSTAESDVEQQVSVMSCSDQDTGTKIFQKFNEEIEQKVDIPERCQLLDTSKCSEFTSTNIQKLGSSRLSDFECHDENNDKRQNSSRSIGTVEKKVESIHHCCNLLGTSKSVELISGNKKKLDDDQSLNFKLYTYDNMREKHLSMGIKQPDEQVMKMENNQCPDPSISQELLKSTEPCRHLLGTAKSVELISGNEKKLDDNQSLDLKLYNRDNIREKRLFMSIKEPEERITKMENNQCPDTSILQELITNNENGLDASNKSCYSSKSVDNVGMKLIPDKNRLSLETCRHLKGNLTPTKTSTESFKKKISKMRRISKKVSTCKKITSASLDEYSCLALVKPQNSFRDLNLEIDHDTMAMETLGSVQSAVTEIISGDRSSLEVTPEFLEETKSPTDKLLINNSCSGKSNSSMNLIASPRIDETLSPKVMGSNSVEIFERNSSKCIEKLSDASVEDIDCSHAKPIDHSMNSLVVEKEKNTAIIEPTNNYQRCGTYVIDRTTNPTTITKCLGSDECLEEKPLLERKHTDQNITNNQLEKKSISSETVNQCLGEKSCRDSKSEINRQNSENNSPNSLGKSVQNLGTTDQKIETIDRDIGEIFEKYVNQHFDYDSDNTFLNDDGTERPTITQKQLPSDEFSNYDSYQKAFSDSIVPRPSISSILSPDSKKEIIQNSIEIRKKIENNMSPVRRSTDILISSVEASERIIGLKASSNAIASCESESTPYVEEETIQKLDFATSGTITSSKMTYCGLLPKIFVDRILTAENGQMTNDKKCSPLNGTLGLSDKARRNSTVKLINLDPPKSDQNAIRKMEQPKVTSLPQVVSASFKKERRRGSCKDYDPFLLAERQMNELLSDTCSDQSFTDFLANRRKSSSPPANNYPLSHSSAFVKYPNPVTKSLNNSVDKRVSLIAPPSEFDDLTADFSSDSTETNSISREILADLEDSLPAEKSFCHESKNKDSRDYILGRRVIIDKSKALGTNEIIEGSNRKHSQTNHKARKILDKITTKGVESPHVTRSSSLRANSAPRAPERKNNNSSIITATKKVNASPGSSLNNRNNNYASLSGSNMSLSSTVSSEVEVKRSNSLFSELASSFEDDVSDVYPSLRSLLKNDSLSISSPVQPDRLRNGQISDEELSSPDGYQKQQQHHTKLSADSAYSSLNRKYSNHGRNTNDVARRQAEDCSQHHRDGDAGSISSATSKLPKFCHECGWKFPETAKFCCECGFKRLTLS